MNVHRTRVLVRGRYARIFPRGSLRSLSPIVRILNGTLVSNTLTSGSCLRNSNGRPIRPIHEETVLETVQVIVRAPVTNLCDLSHSREDLSKCAHLVIIRFSLRSKLLVVLWDCFVFCCVYPWRFVAVPKYVIVRMGYWVFGFLGKAGGIGRFFCQKEVKVRE